MSIFGIARAIKHACAVVFDLDTDTHTSAATLSDLQLHMLHWTLPGLRAWHKEALRAGNAKKADVIWVYIYFKEMELVGCDPSLDCAPFGNHRLKRAQELSLELHYFKKDYEPTRT